MVRFVKDTADTTFKMSGYKLTERAKAHLRKMGFKTNDKPWYEVFKKCDVIYRYNPETDTSDVFIGQVLEAKYRTGNRRVMTPIFDQYETAGTLTDARLVSRGEFIISRDEVKRLRR